MADTPHPDRLMTRAEIAAQLGPALRIGQPRLDRPRLVLVECAADIADQVAAEGNVASSAIMS